MDAPFASSLKNYFCEREKLSQINGWIGESISSQTLTPMYFALRQLKLEFDSFLKREKIPWVVQASMGQGRATPDHYVALLANGQKVSNGIYYCLCFDRIGSGCVCGAMKSLTTRQQIEEDTEIRGVPLEENLRNATWKLNTPYCIDVWMRNNAFYNPIEITKEALEDNQDETCLKLVNHILDSSVVIPQLISKRKNIF